MLCVPGVVQAAGKEFRLPRGESWQHLESASGSMDKEAWGKMWSFHHWERQT